MNHVIYPRIEYLLQDICIDDALKNKINSTVLTTIKHITGYAQMAINSLFTLPLGYNVYDIYYRHAQQHIHTLTIRLND